MLLTVGTNLLDFRSTLFLFTGTAEGLRQEGERGQNSNRFSFIVFIPSNRNTKFIFRPMGLKSKAGTDLAPI